MRLGMMVLLARKRLRELTNDERHQGLHAWIMALGSGGTCVTCSDAARRALMSAGHGPK